MSCMYVRIDKDIFIAGDASTFASFHLMSTIIIEPDRGIVLFGIAMILSSVLTIWIKYKYIPFYTQSQLSPQQSSSQKKSSWDDIIKQRNDVQKSIRTNATDDMSAKNEQVNKPQSPLLFSKNYSFRTFCLKVINFFLFIFCVCAAITLFIAQIAVVEVEYTG